MHEREVHIPEPCTENWEGMIVRAGGKQRFCESCRKDVHDLSQLTEMEARALLAREGSAICVAYERRSDGRILHRLGPTARASMPRAVLETRERSTAPAQPDFVPVTRLRFARKSAGPWARVALVGLLAACAPHTDGDSIPDDDAIEMMDLATEASRVAPPLASEAPPPPVVEMPEPEPPDAPCDPEAEVDDGDPQVDRPKRMGKRIRPTKGRRAPKPTVTLGSVEDPLG